MYRKGLSRVEGNLHTISTQGTYHLHMLVGEEGCMVKGEIQTRKGEAMIIKRYVTATGRAVLRENNYTSTLDKFVRLFEEAQKDFPGLLHSAVEIVQYGGRSYKHTFGIEFMANDAPAVYSRITNPEYKL